MKKFKKMYLEILNVCNLQCSFCPPTTRPPAVMTVETFQLLAEKLRPHGQYLYLHVKGEPTLHPQLFELLDICKALDFRVCITTNGTTLSCLAKKLGTHPAVHKIQVSLHSFEASDLTLSLDEYLDGIVSLVLQAECLVVLRLWNQGGMDKLNQAILEKLQQQFCFLSPDRVNQTTYIEHGDRFEWGDLSQQNREQAGFCYGLRDQIGVLVDGTVVPCCLDNNGDLALGNLTTQTVQDVVESPRAQALYQGFSNRVRTEPLCQTCGFISRFSK